MKKIRFFNALALAFVLAAPLQSTELTNLQDALTALKNKLGQLGTALHDLDNPPVVRRLTEAEKTKLDIIEAALIAKITAEANNIPAVKTAQAIIQELQQKHSTQQITQYCTADSLQNYNLAELQLLLTALNATMDNNNAFWAGLEKEIQKEGYDINDTTDEWGTDELKSKTKSLDLSIKSALAFKTTPISHSVAENLAFLAMLYLERDGLASATVDAFTQLPGSAQSADQAQQETIAREAWALLTEKEKQIVEKCLTIKTPTTNLNETSLQRKIKALINAAPTPTKRPTAEEIQVFYNNTLSIRTLADLSKKESASQKYNGWREKLDPVYLAGILYIFAKDANSYKRIVEDKSTQAREDLKTFFQEPFIKDLFTTDPYAKIFGSTIPADSFWGSLSKTTPSKPRVSTGGQAGVPSTGAFEESDIKDMALVTIETTLRNKKNLKYQDVRNYLKSFPSNKNVIKIENFNITVIKESTLKTIKGALEKLAHSKKTTSQDKQEISILLSKIDPRLEEFKQAQATAPDTKETPGQKTQTQEEQDAAKAKKIEQSKIDIHELCNQIIAHQSTYKPQNLDDYFNNPAYPAAYQLSEIVQIPVLLEYLKEGLNTLMENTGARKVSKIVLQRIFANAPEAIKDFLGMKTQGTPKPGPTSEPQIQPTPAKLKGSKADIDAMAEEIKNEEIQNAQELHHFFNNPTDVEATYQLSEIVTIPELLNHLQNKLYELVNVKKFPQAKLATIFAQAPAAIQTYIASLASATPQKPPLPERPGQPTPKPDSITPSSEPGDKPTPEQTTPVIPEIPAQHDSSAPLTKQEKTSEEILYKFYHRIVNEHKTTDAKILRESFRKKLAKHPNFISDETLLDYLKRMIYWLKFDTKVPQFKLTTIFTAEQKLVDYIGSLKTEQSPRPAQPTEPTPQQTKEEAIQHQELTAAEIKDRKIILYKMYKQIKAHKKAGRSESAETISKTVNIKELFTNHPEFLGNEKLRKYLNKILYSLRFDAGIDLATIQELFAVVPDPDSVLKKFIDSLDREHSPRPNKPNNPAKDKPAKKEKTQQVQPTKKSRGPLPKTPQPGSPKGKKKTGKGSQKKKLTQSL